MGEIPGPESGGPNQITNSITSGYAALIRAALTKLRTSTRALQRAGVIKERTRRLFFEKLDAGALTITEMNEISRYLGINPMRALVAVAYMHDPEAYFDPCCEVIQAYNEQLATTMTKRATNLSGDSMVIHRTLRHCPAHVERISREIVEQQERTRRWLEREGDG